MHIRGAPPHRNPPEKKPCKTRGKKGKGLRRRRAALALALGLLLALWTVEARAQDAPQGSWRAAALVEQSTGRVLFSENGDEELPMASTTKIMTALCAIESGRLDETVEIDSRMVGVEGSSIYLEAGERLTVEELTYGLLLRSGNDAAEAIALTLGGSLEGFAQIMNDRAAALGLAHTHFVNPHGLPAEGHYTSALDLAAITCAAYAYEPFRRIVSTQYAVIPWTGHDYDRAMRNKNKLLASYPGANGVKTGYTKAAGRCLVSGAERDGMQLIAVTLNAPDMWGDAAALLDYGFAQYEMREVIPMGAVVGSVPCAQAEDGEIAVCAARAGRLPLQSQEEAFVRLVLPESVESPVAQGQVLGYAILGTGEEELARIPLCAAEQVVRPQWDYGQSLLRVLRGWMAAG